MPWVVGWDKLNGAGAMGSENILYIPRRLGRLAGRDEVAVAQSGAGEMTTECPCSYSGVY